MVSSKGRARERRRAERRVGQRTLLRFDFQSRKFWSYMNANYICSRHVETKAAAKDSARGRKNSSQPVGSLPRSRSSSASQEPNSPLYRPPSSPNFQSCLPLLHEKKPSPPQDALEVFASTRPAQRRSRGSKQPRKRKVELTPSKSSDISIVVAQRLIVERLRALLTSREGKTELRGVWGARRRRSEGDVGRVGRRLPSGLIQIVRAWYRWWRRWSHLETERGRKRRREKARVGGIEREEGEGEGEGDR